MAGRSSYEDIAGYGLWRQLLKTDDTLKINIPRFAIIGGDVPKVNRFAGRKLGGAE